MDCVYKMVRACKPLFLLDFFGSLEYSPLILQSEKGCKDVL